MDFKVGQDFVFKVGNSIWHKRVLRVKAVTKDQSRIRTYRQIDGRMWIPTDILRHATPKEKKTGYRDDSSG